MTHGELWQKTLAELQRIYGKKGLTPDPLPQEAIEALRVPGVYGGEVTQPLPWDVRFLLGFDRNLTLSTHYRNDIQLFKYILWGNESMLFSPEDVLSFTSPPIEDDCRPFAEEAKGLPAVLSLPQIGGDELPGLWLSVPPENCTPVIHFDYDDVPEFYIRDTCLFHYVLEYLEDRNTSGTEIPLLFTEEQDTQRHAMLEDALDKLNEALMNFLMGDEDNDFDD